MEFSLYPPENVTGASDQPFHVGDPTSQSHAVPADWVGYFQPVTSAATIDIFGAAGATIDLDNSTPVTMTGVTACTSAQVGSVKRIIVRTGETWTITASANMTVDGATSGDTTYPAEAELEIRAKTTSTFAIRTISAKKAWTPSLGGTTTYAAQSGTSVRIGNRVHVECLLIVTLIGTGSTTTISGAPYTAINNGQYSYGDCQVTTCATAVVSITSNIAPNTTTFNFNGRTAAAVSDTSPLTVFGNSTAIRFSLDYIAS